MKFKVEFFVPLDEYAIKCAIASILINNKIASDLPECGLVPIELNKTNIKNEIKERLYSNGWESFWLWDESLDYESLDEAKAILPKYSNMIETSPITV